MTQKWMRLGYSHSNFIRFLPLLGAVLAATLTLVVPACGGPDADFDSTIEFEGRSRGSGSGSGSSCSKDGGPAEILNQETSCGTCEVGEGDDAQSVDCVITETDYRRIRGWISVSNDITGNICVPDYEYWSATDESPCGAGEQCYETWFGFHWPYCG